MTIQWILPTSFYNGTFAKNYTAYSNPFSAGSYIPTFNYLANMPKLNFIQLPKLPIFNYSYPTFTSATRRNYSVGTYSNRGVSVGNNTQNMSLWKRLGYCASAGLKLARQAVNSVVGFIGKCARYVKNAIAKVGMGKYESGNACDMVSIMRRNKKFKEISPNGVNLKTLPAGCVLVYGRGVAGYSSQYGHTEITTGKGTAVSDGVTRNLHRKPTAIFMTIYA